MEAAADSLFWAFTGRTPTEAYILDPEGNKLTYRILAVVPFTSTRKRMSVVVRDPRGRIVVMTKGADNVIFARASAYPGTTRAALDGHLSAFAADGLRTLVLARRELSEAEFEAWYRNFEQAATAVGGAGGGAGREGGERAERMGQAAEAVETGLTVRCVALQGGGCGSLMLLCMGSPSRPLLYVCTLAGGGRDGDRGQAAGRRARHDPAPPRGGHQGGSYTCRRSRLYLTRFP